jgi:hypothetical protein
MWNVATILGLGMAASLGLTACAPPIPNGGFDAPDPASRAYALIDLVRTYRGPDATRKGSPPAQELVPVVAMLDSADPMNRFLAANALRDLTGQDQGYDPTASIMERELAARRWQAWLDAQMKADHQKIQDAA